MTGDELGQCAAGRNPANYCFDNFAREIPVAGCEAGFSDAGEEDAAGLAVRICLSIFFGSGSLVWSAIAGISKSLVVVAFFTSTSLVLQRS